jgi:hypothetical protein
MTEKTYKFELSRRISPNRLWGRRLGRETSYGSDLKGIVNR